MSKTTFAGSPLWGGNKRRKSLSVDVDTLTITNDPLPKGRSPAPHKYDTFFDGIEVGRAVKCQPFEVNKVAKALKRYISDRGIKGEVLTCKHYDDGLGRVFLVKESKVKK